MPFSSSFRATGVRLAGELRVELLARLEHLHPLVVEPGGGVAVELAELLALGEVVQDCELRLGRPKRQLLAAVRDAGGEDRVLQLVLAGAQLDLDEAGLARLAKPVEALALVGARAATRPRAARPAARA